MNAIPPHSARLHLAAIAGLCALAATLGCTQEPSPLPLRSLTTSGPMAFLCLGAPTDGPSAQGHTLRDCPGYRTGLADDYVIPHLYALVTQPVRGEVAVVDLTTESDAVLDQDPLVPGANFLPVGGQPRDIVSTPGGMASFVTVAEPGFEGIYALPSHLIRGKAQRLTSWPSCSLPAQPGSVVLALDPPDGDGSLRTSCDAEYGAPDDQAHPFGNLAAEAGWTGTEGRQKLIVTLPLEGGFAVLDAQDVLDRQPGTFAPCNIERWVPLQVMATTPSPEPLPPELGCVNEDPGTAAPFAEAYLPHPEQMAVRDRRLYITDSAAPVIHIVDLPTPCEPAERPGLLARSAEDPSRIVTTTRLAVTPQTLDFKRYLYAVDYIDGSVMVFDVSDDSTTNTPLQRSAPELNPFQPSDRIRFQTPPRDVVSVQHLNDDADANSGANVPCRCDPDPGSTSCGVGYRTSDNFDSGAGPYRLRGVFSFIVLASGDIVVIDVDDYDAPCRGPKQPDTLYGCAESSNDTLSTSGEYSCRTVVPHQTRAGAFLVQVEDVASRQPGLQAFPVLFDPEGSVLNADDTDEGKAAPRMRATEPVNPPPSFTLPVGSKVYDLDDDAAEPLAGLERLEPFAHTLAMNLEDPRAHILDQSWSVTFEGGLPGFAGHFGELLAGSDGSFVLRDGSSRFCENGVLGQTAMAEILEARGEDAAGAQQLADFVQIVSATPIESDSYWDEQAECTFTACRTEFGTLDQPRPARDLRIVEAYESHLELEPRAGTSGQSGAELKCCFPGVVEFSVRAGSQWTVVGEGVGFLHHVIADPVTGACRNSCDPLLVRQNGRVREHPAETVVADDDPTAFINPFFRFAVTRGQTCDDAGSCKNRPTERDTQFQFTTQNGFPSLALTLPADDADVQPQSIEYLPNTGELVVSDGSLNGITLLDLNALVITRQYN